MLDRVDSRDVDVDEPYVRVLEGRPACGGEVGITGADADHHVGVASNGICGRGAGGADGAEALRMVIDQRALASLALADRNAGRLAERCERILALGSK